MAAPPNALENSDERYMRLAIAQASAAARVGEVPVGAVLVGLDGTVNASGYNQRERDSDPSAHAEIVALRQAGLARRSWRMNELTMYVTLEPCVMCAGALLNARIRRVVYGCRDEKAGATDSLFCIGRDPRLNHRFAVTRGVLERECRVLLERFFQKRRRTTNA